MKDTWHEPRFSIGCNITETCVCDILGYNVSKCPEIETLLVIETHLLMMIQWSAGERVSLLNMLFSPLFIKGLGIRDYGDGSTSTCFWDLLISYLVMWERLMMDQQETRMVPGPENQSEVCKMTSLGTGLCWCCEGNHDLPSGHKKLWSYSKPGYLSLRDRSWSQKRETGVSFSGYLVWRTSFNFPSDHLVKYCANKMLRVHTGEAVVTGSPPDVTQSSLLSLCLVVLFFCLLDLTGSRGVLHAQMD